MPVVKLHCLCFLMIFLIDNFHGRHTDDMHVWERKIWIHVSIYTWRHSWARRI